MELSDYKCNLVLGAGGFGKVYLAKHVATDELYAIKSIRKDNCRSPVSF